jgi:hypothetical protein
MGMLQVTLQGFLSCPPVDPLVVAVLHVVLKQAVYLIQGQFISQLGEKLTANGAKEPFNFALSLGAVGSGIAQPDFKGSTSQLEPVRLK